MLRQRQNVRARPHVCVNCETLCSKDDADDVHYNGWKTRVIVLEGCARELMSLGNVFFPKRGIYDEDILWYKYKMSRHAPGSYYIG